MHLQEAWSCLRRYLEFIASGMCCVITDGIEELSVMGSATLAGRICAQGNEY